MCIVYIGYVFRHSIWHSFWDMAFLLAFYASVLIYFLADMLTFSAYTPTLFPFYLAFILTFPLTALRSGARSSGPPLRSGPGGGPAVCCSSRLRIWRRRRRRRTECTSDKNLETLTWQGNKPVLRVSEGDGIWAALARLNPKNTSSPPAWRIISRSSYMSHNIIILVDPSRS